MMIFDGNQNKETIIINESGLYSLILSSKLPSAKEFKHWVTAEGKFYPPGNSNDNINPLIE